MKKEIKEKNKSKYDKKGELEKCRKQKDEYLAGWQRARADFLNYKKEEIKRLKEIIEYSSEELILKILPILDNLEKAETQIPLDFKDNEWVKGISQVKDQLQDSLKKEGVEEIKTIGERFDPNFHEALEKVEMKNKEVGKIIKEIQKGYTLNNKVIRPAKVKITK
jgi:molecular chaperone GrpE